MHSSFKPPFYFYCNIKITYVKLSWQINSNLNSNIESIAKGSGGSVSADTNTTKTFKTTKSYKILVLFSADFSTGYTQEGSASCNKGTVSFSHGYSAGNEEPHSSAWIKVYTDVPPDATITFKYSCLYRYAAYGIA